MSPTDPWKGCYSTSDGRSGYRGFQLLGYSDRTDRCDSPLIHSLSARLDLAAVSSSFPISCLATAVFWGRATNCFPGDRFAIRRFRRTDAAGAHDSASPVNDGGSALDPGRSALPAYPLRSTPRIRTRGRGTFSHL